MGVLALSSSSSGSASGKGKGGGFRIVRLASILSMSVVAATVSSSSNDTQQTPSSALQLQEEAAVVDLQHVNLDRVKEVEQAAVQEEGKRLARLPPPGVGELGKEIFDALAKTMPARWAGKSM